MPSRRVTWLVAVGLVAAGGLSWRSLPGRGPEPDRVLVRTLSSIAGDPAVPVAILSEDDELDHFVRAAAHGTDAPSLTIVPRSPDAIDAATRAGTLLAGQRGRTYLEVLGFELAWLPQDPARPSFPLARVRGRLRCTPVRGTAWSPLPGLEYTGRLGIVLPAAAGGALALVVGDELPLEVEVTSADDTHVRMKREVLTSVAAAPVDYWIEGRSPRDAPAEIQELTLLASPGRERVLSVRLGRRAPRVLARLRGYDEGGRATVCAAPTGAEDAFADAGSQSVVFPDLPWHFGTGWSDVVLVEGAGPVRWMGRHGALLISLSRRRDVKVTLRAYRSTDAGDGEVSLRINDAVDVPGLPLRPGLQRYEWTVPASAWVTGTNEVLLRVSGAGDARLLAFSRLELTLVP